MTTTDHDQRIARYQTRAAARLPLFEAGEPATDGQRVYCLGCGVKGGHRRGVFPAGWLTREISAGGVRVYEVHCEKCLKEWGWGDLVDPKVRSHR